MRGRRVAYAVAYPVEGHRNQAIQPPVPIHDGLGPVWQPLPGCFLVSPIRWEPLSHLGLGDSCQDRTCAPGLRHEVKGLRLDHPVDVTHEVPALRAVLGYVMTQ